MRIAVRGSGIAGGCCAHLLAMQGIAAAVLPAKRPPVPALLLSDAALTLLRGVFSRPDLFANHPRIERRVVSWADSEAVSVPHGAVVVSESELSAALFPACTMSERSPEPADFTIHTISPFPSGELRSFGQRAAMAAEVHLLHSEDHSACWVEAVEAGWLFLIPSGGDKAWLLAVGATVELLMDQSRHVAPRIQLMGRTSSTFETCPRMLTALKGEDWLACGTAAIAFDPICGDGTAQSIREAIIAAAVVAAISEGGDRAALLTHYESMLIGSMRRHLQLSAQFYESGGRGDWWREQLTALSDGHGWCTARLSVLPEPRYQLRDFRLMPREVAA
ncbi:MAG TPA: hypothetical protein VF503_33070 [Sphingobium sp.]|uniref:hypothetical protein n=1 Tax=Sphingobium sp. TaxID=1912891 RepID=UPI002ED1FE2C